jgi:hypothetical protein
MDVILTPDAIWLMVCLYLGIDALYYSLYSLYSLWLRSSSVVISKAKVDIIEQWKPA